MNDRSADSSRKQKKSERNSCIRIFIGHQKEKEWLSQQKLILWSSCFDNLSQVPENQFFSGGGKSSKQIGNVEIKFGFIFFTVFKVDVFPSRLDGARVSLGARLTEIA